MNTLDRKTVSTQRILTFVLIFLLTSVHGKTVFAQDIVWNSTRISQDSIQNLFDLAEEQKDSLFPASFFDTRVIYMYDFDNKTNVASYRFDNTGIWKQKDYYEYYDGKPNLGSGLKKLSKLVFYRYKTRADRWKETNGFTPFDNPESQLAQRENRFYFFRFTAKTIMPSLDNSMLCVDTYTKFCWFYSEPGKFSNLFGNKIPKAWRDYADPQKASYHEERVLPFYLYDPIGYVSDTGDVILYDWIKTNISKDIYEPSIKFSTPAKRSPDSPGYSPYLPQ